ncbi:MAG: alpha/beta hydrolase [Solirubrobacteraceae bacterium]|nr:alpha/beta hydrolase [Solirubrobacteraceae bacterium]
MADLPAQPDPLSPEAQAILDAPPYPRQSGSATAEEVRAARAAESAARAPVIAELARRLDVVATERLAGGVRVVDVRSAVPAGDGTAAATPEQGMDLPHAPEPAAHAHFLHGGGWIGGVANDMTSVLMADRLRIPVLSVDYSLLPDAPFPVAIEESLTAYRALTAELGGPWVIFGVSAGGNMAVSLTHRIRQEGLPAPVALGLFTPATDLTGQGDSRLANDGRDPVLLHRDDLLAGEALYAGDAPLDDPLVSPIYADYDASFPPTMLTTGTRDAFLSDCTRLYWRLRRAGVRTELRVWENLWHAFNTQPHLPEAAEARDEMADFLLAALAA